MREISGNLEAFVVSKGHGEALAAKAKALGSRGATITYAGAFSHSSVIRALGLGEMQQEMVLILSSDQSLYDKLKDDELVLQAIRLARQQESEMDNKLIVIIASKGYADDIVEAARKAGAQGATVIKGRGTGSEEDVKFLNVTIVPEKEIVLIVSPSENAKAIMAAVDDLDILKQEGSGVLFTCPVESFQKSK